MIHKTLILVFAFFAFVSLSSGLALQPKISGFAGRKLITKNGILQDHIRCPSQRLRQFVDEALSKYQGTHEAEKIAEYITKNVVSFYSGAWITTTSELDYNHLQWSYWGSNTIYGSSNFCFVATDVWLVQVIKVSVM